MPTCQSSVSRPRRLDWLLRCFSAVSLVLLSLCGCLGEDPALPKTPKVLVVGWDGARADATHQAKTPTIDALAAAGAYSYAASTQTLVATVSSPGWLSILTGVQADKHLVTTNDELPLHDKSYPSFLARARADFELRTAAACDWESLCALILANERALDETKVGDERAVTDKMIEWLEEDEADLYFIHIDLPDHAGHDSGFTPDNPDYIEAIEQSDALTGELVAAIEARSTRNQESWLILVTTDHGGDASGHGAINVDNQRIFLVLRSDSAPDAASVVLPDGRSHVDVHPSVLDHMGITIDPAWALDGVSLLPDLIEPDAL